MYPCFSYFTYNKEMMYLSSLSWKSINLPQAEMLPDKVTRLQHFSFTQRATSDTCPSCMLWSTRTHLCLHFNTTSCERTLPWWWNITETSRLDHYSPTWHDLFLSLINVRLWVWNINWDKSAYFYSFTVSEGTNWSQQTAGGINRLDYLVFGRSACWLMETTCV